MPYVINISPFRAQSLGFAFYNGHQYDCLFLKATLKLAHDGTLKPLAQQAGFVINDEYETIKDANFAAFPALQYPSDLTPFKPATDVLVIGHARPQGSKPRKQWHARLKVSDKEKQVLIDKTLQLTGPRNWRHKLINGWDLTEIEETEAVRLSYSLASGGGSAEKREKADDFYPPNPFGRGYLGRDLADKSREYPAPQILPVETGRPAWNNPDRPVGFSPVDGAQMERLRFAGTYDENWEQHVAPNIPLDMDMAFWNAAPRDQVADPYLIGGERVYTRGLFPTEDGVFSFILPWYEVFVAPVRQGEKDSAYAMNIDTVIIDLDTRRVTLRWCVLISQDKGFDEYQVIAYTQNRTAPASAGKG
jgi:hypothetical protein